MRQCVFKRKKAAFSLVLTFLLAFPSFSQNIVEGYWGLKAGLNMNKIGQIEFDNSVKPGFHVGVFANFQLSDNFSLQHEILYSMRGVALQLPSGRKYTQSFSFIDIPWMLNYHFSKNFYITAGIQPSVYAYFRRPVSDTIVYNKDNVNTIDFGYLVGAAFLFDNNLGFGVRFNGSIVPTFDLEGNTGKNYVFQLYAHYAVNKRKGRGKRRR